MKQKQIILGVDPGSQITGYGVIESKAHTIVPIDFGIIKLPAKLEKGKKYFKIFEGVCHLIDQYAPSAIALETQFVYKNVQSALKLGMACSAVLIAAASKNIPVFEYTPKKIKLAVVGTGSASKEQVQHMIQMQLCLPHLPAPFDAADALGIALCHAYNKDCVYV